MSTQFGAGAGDDAIKREADGGDGSSACQADDLRRLIERIADQLNDSDQRQTVALAQMLSRVEALSAEARQYKTRVPQEFLPAFERIEDGVSLLAERIAGTHNFRDDNWSDLHSSNPHEYSSKTAYGPDAADPGAAQALSLDVELPAAIQPFAAAAPMLGAERVQAIGLAATSEPAIAYDEAAWDQQAADALASHYEHEFGAFASDTETDGDEAASNGSRDEAGTGKFAAVDMPWRLDDEATVRDVRASLLDSERDWLEEHFVDIARKVEESLMQRAPDSALTDLGARFELLEQRFGSAMHDVATRTDVEALHILEAHISELAQQFEDTRSQLGRLDGIEHSLAAVIDRLTDPRFDSALERSGGEAPDIEPLISAAVEQIAQRLDGAHSPMPDLHDFAEGIAAAAAERVASHFADLAPSRDEGSGADVDTIRQLLGQFINERREGEEQTAAVLDTMQRALIRVLDRVDALESSNAKAGVDFARYAAEPVAARPHGNVAQGQGGAPDPDYAPASVYDLPQQENVARAYVEPAVPAATSRPPQRQPSSPASIEQLRQDFIADARRAKDKATNTVPEAASTEARTSGARGQVGEAAAGGVKLGKPRAEKVAGTGDVGTSVISRFGRPSRKLVVSAIVLMIAIPGALMLLKKGKATDPSPTPTAIERSQAPGDRSIAPVSPTKQTDDSISRRPDPASEAAKGLKPDAAVRDNMQDGSSSQPSKVEPDSKGGAIAPESKDDLFRTHPKTQSDSLEKGFEVPTPNVRQRDSRLPSDSLATGEPPAGITVATPRKAPSLAQLERLSERNATAQISSQLGEAQINAVPAALIPEFMREGGAGSEAAPTAPKLQASISDSHRQPLDLPPAQVGPLSLRMAAASGNPSAEFAVAARFADGSGVKQDLAEAMRWYQRSASRGFAQSQYRVATLYERGLGAKQDVARAKIWYQRAAESGNVKAMHNLAVLSAGRSVKVPDYTAAAQWFKAAAEYGLADSQFNLAVLHESGLGLKQDAQAAYFWFALAARSGDAEALRRQNELEQSMTPVELAEAKRKLDDWRPKQSDRIANDPLAASEAWKAQAAADGAI